MGSPLARHDRRPTEATFMATRKQVAAAEKNVRKAQSAARSKRTIAHLSPSTRHELGEQAARGRRRAGRPGHALEDRNRTQLYDQARKLNIPGRSKMGKWELIDAIRAAR
jgi:hypothetical protein